MRARVARVDHVVLLTPAAAQLLAAAVRAFAAQQLRTGRRLTPDLAETVDQLERAAALPEKEGPPSGHGITGPHPGPWLPRSAGDPAPLLSTEQVAARLGCSTSSVRQRARRGTLPAHRTGGRWLFPADQVDALGG